MPPLAIDTGPILQRMVRSEDPGIWVLTEEEAKAWIGIRHVSRYAICRPHLHICRVSCYATVCPSSHPPQSFTTYDPSLPGSQYIFEPNQSLEEPGVVFSRLSDLAARRAATPNDVSQAAATLVACLQFPTFSAHAQGKRRHGALNRLLQVSPRCVASTSRGNHQSHPKKFKGVRYRQDQDQYVAEMKPPNQKNKVHFGQWKTEIGAARIIDVAFHHYGLPLNFNDTPQILSKQPSSVGLDEEAKLKLVKEQAKWMKSRLPNLPSTPMSPLTRAPGAVASVNPFEFQGPNETLIFGDTCHGVSQPGLWEDTDQFMQGFVVNRVRTVDQLPLEGGESESGMQTTTAELFDTQISPAPGTLTDEEPWMVENLIGSPSQHGGFQGDVTDRSVDQPGLSVQSGLMANFTWPHVVDELEEGRSTFQRSVQSATQNSRGALTNLEETFGSMYFGSMVSAPSMSQVSSPSDSQGDFVIPLWNDDDWGCYGDIQHSGHIAFGWEMDTQ